VAAVAFVIGLVTGAGAGGGEKAAAGPELPLGGRALIPAYRLVGFFGHPQDEELGELGIGTPAEVAERLENQADDYEIGDRPVQPTFELIATIASRTPGDSGLYREDTDHALIQKYLDAARAAKAYLILDIQPGYEDFLTAAKRLEPFLKEPDVGLALDPEWHVPEGTIPGQEIGSVFASDVNEVGEYLSQLVTQHKLPQKLLLVHSFTEDMIKQRGRLVRYPGLATVINIDGFGTPGEKTLKYQQISRPPPTWHWGFKLFYKEDTDLMSPDTVMKITPRPDIVLYE